jgi:hypothetical protein
MKMVEGLFMLYKDINSNAAGNADRQPQYIDGGVKFVSPEITEGAEKVIFKHKM